MSDRDERWTRRDFRVFRLLPTRWKDVDVYGHVNNVEYYSYFDTAVNGWLVEAGLLDPARSDPFAVVAETGCRFLSELRFPEAVEAGIRVAHLGRSSVRYEIGIFKAGDESPCAQGHFVHVYVDREARRPAAIPEAARAALEALRGGPDRTP
jgi:acyl-CoA thioester hydrolase